MFPLLKKNLRVLNGDLLRDYLKDNLLFWIKANKGGFKFVLLFNKISNSWKIDIFWRFPKRLAVGRRIESIRKVISSSDVDDLKR